MFLAQLWKFFIQKFNNFVGINAPIVVAVRAGKLLEQHIGEDAVPTTWNEFLPISMPAF